MTIVVKGQKRRVRPSIERFICGFMNGFGWAVGFGITMLFILIVLGAIWNYAVWH